MEDNASKTLGNSACWVARLSRRCLAWPCEAILALAFAACPASSEMGKGTVQGGRPLGHASGNDRFGAVDRKGCVEWCNLSLTTAVQLIAKAYPDRRRAYEEAYPPLITICSLRECRYHCE
jgi:hypothetical protein